VFSPRTSQPLRAEPRTLFFSGVLIFHLFCPCHLPSLCFCSLSAGDCPVSHRFSLPASSLTLQHTRCATRGKYGIFHSISPCGPDIKPSREVKGEATTFRIFLLLRLFDERYLRASIKNLFFDGRFCNSLHFTLVLPAHQGTHLSRLKAVRSA
jgi:hypothetical protein